MIAFHNFLGAINNYRNGGLRLRKKAHHSDNSNRTIPGLSESTYEVMARYQKRTLWETMAARGGRRFQSVVPESMFLSRDVCNQPDTCTEVGTTAARAEKTELHFNDIVFAANKICDALFSLELETAEKLIKKYGAFAPIMSLVERRLQKAEFDCQWRRSRENPVVGEFVLRGYDRILQLSSDLIVVPKAWLRKETSDGLALTVEVCALATLIRIIAGKEIDYFELESVG